MTNLDQVERGNADISLREITFATIRDILGLDVSEMQRGYVGSNAVSIAEAHYNPGAWFRVCMLESYRWGSSCSLTPTFLEPYREIQ